MEDTDAGMRGFYEKLQQEEEKVSGKVSLCVTPPPACK